MYAVIKTGGKQYKVTEGDVLRVEKLNAEVNATVELTEVLFVANGETVKVGTPVVEGAKVVNFKYKPKKGYHRKKGHRQSFTEIKITSINA